ncbi:hypothetical protein HYH03_002074 [Edaphochlamys debaryana]|uniref:Argonaute-like protein n=1 Tax=Edaphochlamys debaryana TaxID=47281 RepID=A0A835YDU7_9CHLO|nr:hypothetical protein HYH03_002074 [Edaphochlamys debaryana]|eukprot:KAG2499777.1 hypothetical protein HYH03_002074 [Edaphochlamys debaryana]
MVDLTRAGAWWANVFKGMPQGPIPSIKLANGRAARPAPSTAGRPVTLLTNHVRLKVDTPPVFQYEVTVNIQPPTTTKPDAPGGKDPKPKPAKPRDTAVRGAEAQVVLSYILDGPAGGAGPAKDAWVYDGGAALFTVASGDLGTAGSAPASPDGGTDAQRKEGVVRQPDGGLLVRMPAPPKGAAARDASPAAGSTYLVRLRRTGLVDVRSALQQAEESTPARPAAQPDPPSGGDAPRAPSPVAAATAAALAVLELVSRAAAAWSPDSVRVGSGSYVSYKDEGQPLRGLLPIKLLRGFRSSLTLGAEGPTLAVDTALAAVAGDGPLLQQLRDALGPDPAALAKQLRTGSSRLEAGLAGLEVKASHTGFTHKLSGRFTPTSAAEHTFTDRDTGKAVSVQVYFKSRYGVTLQRPDLPCALDKKGAALPVELLTVVRSQKRTARLDARQQAELIRAAAARPADRLAAARKALSGSLQGLQGGVARAFGLSLADADFLTVDGRLLPGVLLEASRPGGQRGGVQPGNEGSWRLPGVAAPGVWRSGAVVCYLDKDGATERAVADFLRGLDKALGAIGGATAPPAGLPVVWARAGGGGRRDAGGEAQRAMEEAVREAQRKFNAKPQLVLVLLPAKGDDGVYDAIKAAGDGGLGVPTQCVKAAKADLEGRGPAPSYLANLALGVNAKLGGITTRPAGPPKDWVPELRGKRLMVLGADVSRGAAAVLGDAGAEAAAGLEFSAVVGSVDSHSVRYAQAVSAQAGGGRDLILGMRESAGQLLRAYAAAAQQQPGAPRAADGAAAPIPASRLPEVLLMCRDGVSDSMFDAVLAYEFTAIKQACADVGGPGYRPAVTFAVIQKTHNTRFFPASPQDADRSGNVRPGTAVDSGPVVDRAEFEFFLNTHAGIQGTNRVPRWHVLVDEYGFTSEGLQMLIWTLAHSHPACNRSVSLPPAAHLAHKAAERARTALKGNVSRLAGAGKGGKRGGGGGGGSGQQAAPAAGTATGGWYEMLDTLTDANAVI